MVYPPVSSVLPFHSYASIACGAQSGPEPAEDQLLERRNQFEQKGVHELLSIGHELTRILGARVHLFAQPFLTRHKALRNGMSGTQASR